MNSRKSVFSHQIFLFTHFQVIFYKKKSRSNKMNDGHECHEKCDTQMDCECNCTSWLRHHINGINKSVNKTRHSCQRK